VEVYIRAANDRGTLARADYLAASNGVPVTGVNGRYIEVRLALTRTNAAQLPAVHDLTLHGLSSSFNSDAWLDDVPAYETQDAHFWPYVIGPEPLTYQWYVQYPWMNSWEWKEVTGGTNWEYVLTNVDSWVGGYLDGNDNFHWTRTSVLVTDAAGESLWLGPARLDVWPLLIGIPAAGSSGAASRYPATINVFGQPTNFSNVSVTVSLWNLTHQHSADLDILLLGPSGASVMLMSHVGGTNNVTDANIRFQQYQALPSELGRLVSGSYQPSNYGQISELPHLGLNPPPNGPYSTNLTALSQANPNGVWKLYLYDDHAGGAGSMSGSSQGTWQLRLDFQ
jgi:subtilisin-like proprotein convertase family protein